MKTKRISKVTKRVRKSRISIVPIRFLRAPHSGRDLPRGSAVQGVVVAAAAGVVAVAADRIREEITNRLSQR